MPELLFRLHATSNAAVRRPPACRLPAALLGCLLLTLLLLPVTLMLASRATAGTATLLRCWSPAIVLLSSARLPVPLRPTTDQWDRELKGDGAGMRIAKPADILLGMGASRRSASRGLDCLKREV